MHSLNTQQKNYILSLDIGTGSVGYSTLDEDYNVLKYGNKEAIGSYIFDSAETAASRRRERGMRRRYNRRTKRLGLLQEIFEPIINNQNFIKSSKRHTWKNNNHDFKNRSLSETLVACGYKADKYPTIYHLQKDLIKNDKKMPLELVYLAIYHLVKYRGHFLFEQLDFNKGTTGMTNDAIKELIKHYEVITESSVTDYTQQQLNEINTILTDQTKTRKDRERELKTYIPHNTEIIKMLLGMKFNQAKLFAGMENEEEIKLEKKESFSFDSEYEDKISEVLTDEQYELIEKAESAYMTLLLEKIKGTYESIAEAKVEEYNLFKKQLRELKAYIRKNHKKDYRTLFISSKQNYQKWVNAPDTKTLQNLCLFDQYMKSYQKDGKTRQELFNNKVKALISKKNKVELTAYENDVLKLIEDDRLLNKLNTVRNASIPVQNSQYEAKKILSNQMKHYPSITEEVIQKVDDIIGFRIPYYIGPLVKGDKNQKFGWMKRNRDTPIKPWNFDEIVNKEESAEKFIRRMTNSCSYLMNEDVLPKHSLLYQEMEVLNELNGIQIRSDTDAKRNVHRIETPLKNWIIDYVFKNHKNVSSQLLLSKMAKSPFKENVASQHGEKLLIFGTQKENAFASKLSTYIDMKQIFDDVESQREMVEEIILWLTIFNDKQIIRKKIKDTYSGVTDEQLKKLLKLNYSGWGRLSEKLLTEEINSESIIDRMRNRSITFMEAVTDEAIKNFITSQNQENRTDIKYKDIEDLRCSPALKRGIWSAIKIVKEVTELFGEPRKIIVEFAREDEEKGKRTKSRKQLFQDLIKDNKLQKDSEYQELIKQSDHLSEKEFKDDRVWLYFMQLGKCAYTQEPINSLDKLINGSKDYEVDHIYPQHFVKDDSLDNKVLVKADWNQRKSGMPLKGVNDRVIKWWDHLHDKGLMSSKKIARLKKPAFTDADKEGFIKRQLVETRQITVHVKDLLEEAYPSVKVIPMKSGIVSKFRYDMDIRKVRSLNDKHHAIDAYLIANIYQAANQYYRVDFFDFNFKTEKVKKKWKEIDGNESMSQKLKNKEFFLFRKFKNAPLIENQTLEQILNNRMSHLNINVIKKTGIHESSFYKQTAYSPKAAEAKYESTKKDFQVYTELKKSRAHIISYFVEDKKGNLMKKIEMVDELVLDQAQHDLSSNDKIANYFGEKLEGQPVLKAKKHLTFEKGDLLIMKEHPVYFVSAVEVINAKQFNLSVAQMNELSKLMNIKHPAYYEKNHEKALKIYEELTNQYIQEYEFLLKSGKNREKHIKEIKNFFKETDQSQQSFIECIDNLFKATSASSARFEKIGRRLGGLSKNAFLGKENNTKIIYQSITGLKQTRPKSIFKLVESGVEL